MLLGTMVLTLKRKLQIWNEGRNGRKNIDIGLKLEASVRINYLKLCVCVNKFPLFTDMN